MRARPGERDRITPEPLLRLGALRPPGGGTARAPSYEERAGALIRRAAPPDGLAAGELEHVWSRLSRARRSAAPRVLGSWRWARWSVAMAVLGVSGAAVAAVTGAWTWPLIAWRQLEGSPAAPTARRAAFGAPRARPLAAAARGLAASPLDPPAMPAPALAAAPVSPAADPEPLSSPTRLRAPRAVPSAGPLGVPSRAFPSRQSDAAAGSPPSIAPPGAPSSVPAAVTPAPFAAARPAGPVAGPLAGPRAARREALPGDRALAEEGELLGRAVARLRQAHDPSGALADLDRYAARFPSGVLHREAQAARVDALLLARRPADARRVLEQLALGADARDRELRLIRAELAAESVPARALEDFRAVWAAHPSGATGERSLWGMAGCHARLGDEAATRAALELYLARFPDGPHAAAAATRAARRD